ncbi:hypothetical protein [Lentimonas sp. CC10]|uniref:hypothetical protein n=1 Tax=Lentimonas sp. CC10 TaxID=2676095 RepID=UPI0013896938|nr:hypothetical protein [Lentimonas sp. CC10]
MSIVTVLTRETACVEATRFFVFRYLDHETCATPLLTLTRPKVASLGAAASLLTAEGTTRPKVALTAPAKLRLTAPHLSFKSLHIVYTACAAQSSQRSGPGVHLKA